MTYLSWAAFYEGPGDSAYFDVLLPRILEEIMRTEGTHMATIPEAPAIRLGQRGREADSVAKEVCKNRESFHLLFVHTDTGGRHLQTTADDRGDSYCQACHNECAWKLDRCVVLAPRHETEAWALADPQAVADVLGYRGKLEALGLPADAAAAERLPDPKAVLEQAARYAQKRRTNRGVSRLLPAIAQTQTLTALRGSQSFQAFEARLRASLMTLGCLNPLS